MAFPYDQTPAENMIDGQLAPNGITHQGLLASVRSVARELFVPLSLVHNAYVDEDMVFGHGRFLMEPLTQLKLLQALKPKATESVLIIGGATGYSAALLAPLVARICMVEQDHALAAKAHDILEKTHCSNVHVVQNKHAEGAAGMAPYDAILIEGAVEHIPQIIFDQLKEGGRLFSVVTKHVRPTAQLGTKMGMGHAARYEKHHGKISSEPLFDAGVGMLSGFENPATFSFH